MRSCVADHFLDATIILLAAGEPSTAQHACRSFLEAQAASGSTLHMSVEGVQEVLFHRMRMVDPGTAVAEARDVQEMVVLHRFDEGVLQTAISLVATSTVRGRDAVHAATAIRAGFDAIVTTDSDFDGIPGLRRIDPRDT
jgi:predicted nucleic acid-binding protein